MESLAVKYRPATFAEVCSQEATVRILSKMAERRTFKNTLLFCGASGCGKTTIARIFADMVNQHQGLPIEIDGASNNGVENIRDIVRSATERSLNSEYKIYIIDECHALTSQAWQAFLKCIEEPPHYTIFIFCTTDPQKIPQTILNRVMRFNFNRIPSSIIYDRLMYICKQEGFTNYKETCDYISRISNGGMRDAIALLEKCAEYSTDLDIKNSLACIDHFSYELFFKLINFLIDGKEGDTLKIINEVYFNGDNLKLFEEQFLVFCLDVLKYSLFKSVELTKIPSSLQNQLEAVVNFDNASAYYSYVVDKLLAVKNMLKEDQDVKSTLEIGLLNIARCK